MKKLLFILPLFLTFSAKAMNFFPLTEEETPKKNYHLHMTVVTEVMPTSGPFSFIPTRFVEYGSDIKDMEVIYSPYAPNPGIVVPIGVPMGLLWFTTDILTGKPPSPSYDLSTKSDLTDTLTREIVGKQIKRVTLTPEQLKNDLLKTMKEIQGEGNKRVLQKNRDLFSWTKSFLSDLPEWGQGRLDEKHFINAAHLLAYCFSGEVNKNALEDSTFLQASILGKELVLKKSSAYRDTYSYNRAKVNIFKAFLKDLGFFLEDGRLKIKK
jgi:hypothetical protein